MCGARVVRCRGVGLARYDHDEPVVRGRRLHFDKLFEACTWPFDLKRADSAILKLGQRWCGLVARTHLYQLSRAPGSHSTGSAGAAARPVQGRCAGPSTVSLHDAWPVPQPALGPGSMARAMASPQWPERSCTDPKLPFTLGRAVSRASVKCVASALQLRSLPRAVSEHV